ncbi:ABC transporter permease, partial [Lachnotalea glycerini]
YTLKRELSTQVNNTYESPSWQHWLGTDGNGMDVMTRLMYGGRISLLIGFVVVILEIVLGIIIGGIAGYFGGWIDSLFMRIVDVFNCIPAMPLYIILGAIMDFLKINPSIRIYFLCIILGLLSWPQVARMVRGQILSLREQEFMIATEATGLRTSKRIFKHLIPNVIPQIIVMATMGLGNVILMEATLSFFGLGVKYPYASWGNIVNAVNDIYVMTNFWFIWIPAGFLILITVLGFNFIGDGLRDAFDPKMKR